MTCGARGDYDEGTMGRALELTRCGGDVEEGFQGQEDLKMCGKKWTLLNSAVSSVLQRRTGVCRSCSQACAEYYGSVGNLFLQVQILG